VGRHIGWLSWHITRRGESPFSAETFLVNEETNRLGLYQRDARMRAIKIPKNHRVTPCVHVCDCTVMMVKYAVDAFRRSKP